MTALAERIEAREQVIRSVLEILAAERAIPDDPTAAARIGKAERDLELRCRDLTAIIDELPPTERPKGWGLGPGGRTA